jgi:hypothetical protein
VQYDSLLTHGRLKTGTIVLFHALDNINPVIIGSYWGHMGIVWVDPDDPSQTPWVFEAAPAKQMPLKSHHNPNGIFINRLEDRVKRYAGFVAIKELSGCVSDQKARDFKTFINFALVNLSYNYNCFANAARKLIGERINKKVNCGEMVFLSAIKLGILNKKEYTVPRLHHLLYMARIQDTQLGKYKDPVYVLHAPFE